MLVAGKGAKGAADAAAKLQGRAQGAAGLEADELATAPGRDRWPTPWSRWPATTTPSSRRRPPRRGKNVLPRIAALLDVSQISEIIEVRVVRHLQRPIYAGNAIQTVQSPEAKKVITVRTAGFQAAVRRRLGSGRDGFRRRQSRPVDLHRERAVGKRPSGTRRSAQIIISGGRALGSSEKFQEVILPVADKLGAAVGASPRRRGRRLCAPTTGRSARPARWWRPALHRRRHLGRDPAPGRHEGLRRSSSPSTRTRRRRSSRSPTTAWWATSSRSFQRLRKPYEFYTWAKWYGGADDLHSEGS